MCIGGQRPRVFGAGTGSYPSRPPFPSRVVLATYLSDQPTATFQPTDWAWFNGPSGPGSAPGGTAVRDPVTGADMIPLTTPTYPVPNGYGKNAYSAYQQASRSADDGSAWVVWVVAVTGVGEQLYLTRVTRGTSPSISTPQPLVLQPGATRGLCAFSLDPATPWLLHVVIEGSPARLHAIDARTNTEVTSVNGATYPVVMPELNGRSLYWLTSSRALSRVCLYGQGSSPEFRIAVYDTSTGALVRQADDAFLDPDGRGFNEVSIDPTGTIVSVRYETSSESRLWYLSNNALSASFATPSGPFASHATWLDAPDGPYLIAADSSSSITTRQKYLKPFSAIVHGGSPGTYTGPSLPQGELTGTNHTSSFFAVAGADGPQQYTIGAPWTYYTHEPTPGAWTSLGGGVWSTTANVSGGMREATGIIDLWECAPLGGNVWSDAIATLTRRPNGTTSLAAGEWSVDAISSGTQVCRVRLADGLTPAGRVHLSTGARNHYAAAAVRLGDGADVRLLARFHSLAHHPVSGNNDYDATEKVCANPGPALVLMGASNRGKPGGRTDVFLAVLPAR